MKSVESCFHFSDFLFIKATWAAACDHSVALSLVIEQSYDATE